jgi:hypothetical protein
MSLRFIIMLLLIHLRREGSDEKEKVSDPGDVVLILPAAHHHDIMIKFIVSIVYQVIVVSR